MNANERNKAMAQVFNKLRLNRNMANREIAKRVRDYNWVAGKTKNQGLNVSKNTVNYSNYISNGKIFNERKRRALVEMILEIRGMIKKLIPYARRGRMNELRRVENALKPGPILELKDPTIIRYIKRVLELVKLLSRENDVIETNVIIGGLGLKQSQYKKLEGNKDALNALKKRINFMNSPKFNRNAWSFRVGTRNVDPRSFLYLISEVGQKELKDYLI